MTYTRMSMSGICLGCRFLLKNWYVFFILSLGWELIELILPYEFAIESWNNKISDILVNCIGFYLGVILRKDNT